MIVPEVLGDDDVEAFIKGELDHFVPMQPRPLSMQEVLDMLEPQRIAKFLHVEVPIRIAERIRWIQDIPNWEDIKELREIHTSHMKVFRDLRLVQRRPTLDAFTAVVQHALHAQQPVRHKVAIAMHRLHTERGEEFGSGFTDPWADDFLLNCIGTEMLMSQCLFPNFQEVLTGVGCITLLAYGDMSCMFEVLGLREHGRFWSGAKGACHGWNH